MAGDLALHTVRQIMRRLFLQKLREAPHPSVPFARAKTDRGDGYDECRGGRNMAVVETSIRGMNSSATRGEMELRSP